MPIHVAIFSVRSSTTASHAAPFVQQKKGLETQFLPPYALVSISPHFSKDAVVIFPRANRQTREGHRRTVKCADTSARSPSASKLATCAQRWNTLPTPGKRS